MGIAALLALLGAGVSSARAQPTGAPVEASQKADTYFREGNDLYGLGKFVEAEGAYEKAWSLKKAHDIAANLGYAEMRQGKTLEAIEHLAYAVRNWPPTGKEDKRQYAVERYLTLRRDVGGLSIDADRAGAEVSVDGKVVGVTPLDGEVFVEAGTRVVEAKAAGYAGAKQTVTVEKGASKVVRLELGPAVATSGSQAAKPAQGAGGAGGSVEAGVAASPTKPSSASTTEESGPRKGVIIGGIVASALAVSSGVVFAIVSSANASTADERTAALVKKPGASPCYAATPDPDCEPIKSALEAQRTFKNLAAFSFVIGGALGAATGIYALATRVKPTNQVHVIPVASPRIAGILLTGGW